MFFFGLFLFFMVIDIRILEKVLRCWKKCYIFVSICSFMSIFENLERIRNDIYGVSCGVKLVVVTKRRSSNEVDDVLSCGVRDIGESYLSEAGGKFCGLKWGCCKHFIGPIQSNKVREIVRNFDVIQSVDRLKIVGLIDRFSREVGKVQRVFIQVNISREEQKSGVLPEELFEFMEEIRIFGNVKVEGLMCIGKRLTVDGERLTDLRRMEFREMRRLFNKLNRFGCGLCELSMGMSDDYMMAIGEGSTMVRIGKGVFEKLLPDDRVSGNGL